MIDHVAAAAGVVVRGTLDHSTQVIYQGDLQMCESALHAFVHVTLAFLYRCGAVASVYLRLSVRRDPSVKCRVVK